MLNIANLMIIFVYLYGLSFIVGYFLFDNTPVRHYSMPTMLAIFTATGICILMLVSYVIAFMLIHWSVLIIPLFLIIPVITFKLLASRTRINVKISVKALLKNLIIVILNIIPLMYFIIATNTMKWPMPGDLIGHGLYISLLRYNRRLTFLFEPLSPYSDYYPRGFHVFVANLAELTGLYSGEAVLVTGAFLSSLMPPLLFSLTYIATKSMILSLIPYLVSFHIHSAKNLEMWVFGYLYNGPYPCFTSILYYVLLACLIVIFRESRSIRILFLLSLVLIQLFSTYPNFFITATPIILLLMRDSLLHFIKKSKWMILFYVFLTITVLPTICFVATFYLNKYMAEGMSASFKINPIYFSDWSTWLMLLAVPMGIYLLFKNRSVDVPTIFLVTFLLNAISINNEAYRFLSLILPSRLIIVSWILSWVVISIFISTLLRRVEYYLDSKERKTNIMPYIIWGKRSAKIDLSQKYLKILILKLSVIVLVLAMVYPSLYQHFSLSTATYCAWYSRSSSFPYDYNASAWISQNIPPDELILNDMSYSGLYLPSYTFKNIIFHYFIHPSEYNEARLIWLHADNETLVRNILKKLNIKWIYTTSEWSYLDLWMYGGSGKYVGKPFKPAKYIEIFDNYSFLKKRYQCGNSAVYEVMET
jgi:hypothetical protein